MAGSGAHYASIVSRTTDAGFGYAVGPNGAVYYVGVYGTPPAGDEVGETEEEISAFLDQEKKAAEKLAAEKAAAVNDPNVKPASATTRPGAEASQRGQTRRSHRIRYLEQRN